MLGIVYHITNLGKCKLVGRGGVQLHKLPISDIVEYYSSLTFSIGSLVSSLPLNCSLTGHSPTVVFHLNFGFQRQLTRLLIYHTLPFA